MGKGGENVQAAPRTKKISLEELSHHRTPDNAWLSYKGKVYDVSNWEDHPGGSVIFTHAGDDMTDIFAAFHPATALKDLQRFEIGDLDESIVPSALYQFKLKPEKQKEFEKAYRDLRAKILAAGLFNPSLPYYAYKVATNLTILAISVFFVVKFESFFMHMIGGLFMALFWQQCGWLSHDFLHHQVFKNRFYGDFMGLLLGDLCQGFSVQWWKSKHNAHHAVPNLHASNEHSCDGDPDIDTMPILAWSLRMAETAKNSAVGRFMIQWQAVFYFPVLLLARISWSHQSWVFVWGGFGQHSVKGAQQDQKKIQYPGYEKLFLVLHYVGLFWLFSYMTIAHSIAFYFMAQTGCGLMLAMVFGLGHNGMAVYPADQRPDFWKLQVTTTRNVTSNWFVDWFCGGLHYQVEHHLFPMIPRHNLKTVHNLVTSFCKEQGVSYHEAGMIEGNIEVLQHLSKVSAEFLKEFPAM